MKYCYFYAKYWIFVYTLLLHKRVYSFLSRYRWKSPRKWLVPNKLLVILSRIRDRLVSAQRKLQLSHTGTRAAAHKLAETMEINDLIKIVNFLSQIEFYGRRNFRKRIRSEWDDGDSFEYTHDDTHEHIKMRFKIGPLSDVRRW